jgi:excinuclease ABC subunit A
LEKSLRRFYAASEDAQALGVSEKELSRLCTPCKGRGAIRIDMGFLPDVFSLCDTCQGTGLLAEAWEIRLRGTTLPDLYAQTIDEVYQRFGDLPSLAKTLEAAREVGLGYLVLRQHGYSLSGGEAQRLKIVRELSKATKPSTLYILDEPTVGQHLEDVSCLVEVLHRLVEDNHSVVVIEHHPHLLASCDWLIELGPGGGPEGGKVIATGTPETLASGDTPISPYLQAVLEASQ